MATARAESMTRSHGVLTRENTGTSRSPVKASVCNEVSLAMDTAPDGKFSRCAVWVRVACRAAVCTPSER